MGKKYSLFLFVPVLAALAMVTSCDLAGPAAPAAPPFVAPDMGGPADLAALGGTAPADEAAATTLFMDALWAFQDTMLVEGTQTPRSILGGRFMVTEPFADTISWVGPGPGGEGTVNITGSVTGSTSLPGETFQPQPNTTYNDLLKVSGVTKVRGTVSGIIVTDRLDPISYTMSGGIDVDGSFEMDVDVTFGTEGSPGSSILNFSFAQKAGYAFSIRRDDGVGAKFILSYAHRVSRSGIPLDNPEDSSAALVDVLGTATLRVYNDANRLLFTIPVSLSEVSGV